EARIAADSRARVGIHVLRGSLGVERRRQLRARAREPGVVREVGADARDVPRVARGAVAVRRSAVAGAGAMSAITSGPSRAAARAMLKAVGFTDDDLHKPIVGIAN